MEGQAVSYPPPLRADNQFSVWSQQMDEVLEKITHRWRGETEKVDRDGTIQWVRGPDSQPAMNDAGIDFIISSIHSMANKNTNLSNLTKDEAYRITRIRSFSITKALYLNYEKYDIKPHQFEEICLEITAIFLLACMRPVNQGEKNFLGKTGIEQKIQQIVGKEGGLRLFG